MRVILGIGNKGDKYRFNRHNAGFLALDFFAAKHNLSFKPSKSDFYFTEGSLAGHDFLLVKPSNYVNNSGIAANFIYNNFKISVQDLLVVYDDINLPVGSVRFRTNGGDGGHNGMNSIIYHLESKDFPRLRIGIGSQFEKGQMADYVLSDFNKEEEKLLTPVFENSLLIMESFIINGIKGALDSNSKISKAEPRP